MTMTTSRALKAPTLHLNGSSQEALLTVYRDAEVAAKAMIDAVAATCPHARDYMTEPDDLAYSHAMAEHRSRLRAAEDLLAQFTHLKVAVMRQKAGTR
jgi:hypothetical protein